MLRLKKSLMNKLSHFKQQYVTLFYLKISASKSCWCYSVTCFYTMCSLRGFDHSVGCMFAFQDTTLSLWVLFVTETVLISLLWLKILFLDCLQPGRPNQLQHLNKREIFKLWTFYKSLILESSPSVLCLVFVCMVVMHHVYYSSEVQPGGRTADEPHLEHHWLHFN